MVSLTLFYTKCWYNWRAIREVPIYQPPTPLLSAVRIRLHSVRGHVHMELKLMGLI